MKMAKASQKEIYRLMRWLQAHEKTDDPPPPFLRVVFGYETLLQNCADPDASTLEFKPGILAALDDAELLDYMERGWLVGRTADGGWQAAPSHRPELAGQSLQAPKLRDVLRQVREFEKSQPTRE
jgi:hypothetical protein